MQETVPVVGKFVLAAKEAGLGHCWRRFFARESWRLRREAQGVGEFHGVSMTGRHYLRR